MLLTGGLVGGGEQQHRWGKGEVEEGRGSCDVKWEEASG